MADTLEYSLRSVLEQVTDEFEVLVVDGGSTDGSVEILSRLKGEYSNFRYLLSPYGSNGTRGADRALSVSEANGKYVLTHIDADDRYDKGILDAVKLFHEIEEQVNKRLFLWISHIAIASKDHFLDLGSYRNVHAGEDIDISRRAIASDITRYLEIKCDPFWEQIGEPRNLIEDINHKLEIHISDFQVGITLANSVRWFLDHEFNGRKPVHLVLVAIAYCIAKSREQFDPAIGVPNKGLNIFKKYRYTLEELENQFGISVDNSIFSKRGRKYLFRNIDGHDARYIFPDR